MSRIGTRSRPLRRSNKHRRGQALVEFAIIAFILTLLFGAMLTFGFLLFGANVLQQAADVGAQEFSRLPLPPAVEFPDLGTTGRSSTDPSATISGSVPNVFADPEFAAQIFDEQYLVVDLDNDLAAGQTLSDYFADKPIINRLLQTLLIHQEHNGQRLVRYPGALVTNPNTSELTVLIPVVTDRAATGEETTIEWHAVIEEIRSEGNGPLSLNSSVSGFEGMVALRINYPFQSGAMIAYQYELEDGSISGNVGNALGEEGILNHPVPATDGNFNPPSPYTLEVQADSVTDGLRSHSGRYGMGHLEAFDIQVRPYRKVLSAQAIYRREVFE